MGNQSKYRTWREVLIEHSLDAVVGMDKNHKVIDWNLQAEKTFGWNRDYILGKSLPEHLIPKEFHEAHFLGLKRFLATGEAHIIDKRVELEALTRSGKRIPIELTVSPVEIDNELFFYAFLRDISDRKERENEIHSYRQTLENVLMHAPFAISLRQGPGHRFVYVNKAYEDLSGKKLSEIEGKTQDEAFPELSQTDMRRIYDVCFDRGETIVKEEFFIPASQSPTKTPKYCKLIMQPLFDQDNKVTGLVSFIQDISKAVEARKHAEQVAYQIRLIIDASPAFIAFVDRDFRYQFTNKHYEHIFNIDSRTIKDTPIIDVIGKETFEKSLPFYQKALSGESAHLDSSITAKNGDKLYLDIQYVPFRPDKEVLGMVIIAHDITERKIESDDQKLLAELTSYYAINAEESEIIAKATELLARRLNASRCWIAEASQEHSISVVHQNYTDGVSSLVGKWDLNNFGKEMVSAWRSGRIVYVNDVMTDSRTKDSAAAHMSIDIRSFISVPLHRGGKLMALLDISCEYPRNWTNRELEIARAVGESLWSHVENNRLLVALKEAVQARDEFISICSHELKTPITSMKLQNEMAARQFKAKDPRYNDPDTVEKRINNMGRQLDRMARLIEDMLDVSRIAGKKLQMDKVELDIKELISEVIERFQGELENHHIKITVNLPSLPLMIQGDSYRIEQVISNLLSNAIKYGEDGPIEVELRKNQATVIITIKDHGPGIMPENLERIFQRFERAVSAINISGLGLGLYISRQIVEAHDGKLWVESQMGKGSTFIMELPIY